MKTKNDGYSILRCMVLTLLSGICLLAMELVIIPCSYADGASDKMASNASVGQTNEKGVTMKGYVQNIEELTVKNTDFRRVLYTSKQSQLVLMALNPKGEIGAVAHKSDQFFAWMRVQVKRLSMAFGQQFKQASLLLPLVGRITTSSIPALFQ